MFQLTAARRRLAPSPCSAKTKPPFQLTAARRRLADIPVHDSNAQVVSTHSRPKAAGLCCWYSLKRLFCFNSQPPEGGWEEFYKNKPQNLKFQLTAARRRLEKRIGRTTGFVGFNSQPPEGGWQVAQRRGSAGRRFNSQPPEGGWRSARTPATGMDGFNSQPPEGGWYPDETQKEPIKCFNSQPPEGGWPSAPMCAAA